MDKFKEKMEESLKNFKKKEKERKQYNIRCLKIIRNMVYSHPELRFGQILAILKLDGDIFNEESVDTYNRIKKF